MSRSKSRVLLYSTLKRNADHWAHLPAHGGGKPKRRSRAKNRPAGQPVKGASNYLPTGARRQHLRTCPDCGFAWTVTRVEIPCPVCSLSRSALEPANSPSQGTSPSSPAPSHQPIGRDAVQQRMHEMDRSTCTRQSVAKPLAAGEDDYQAAHGFTVPVSLAVSPIAGECSAKQ